MFFVAICIRRISDERWYGVILADGPQHARHIAELRLSFCYDIEISGPFKSRHEAEELLRGMLA